jgi:hypothetical protein
MNNTIFRQGQWTPEQIESTQKRAIATIENLALLVQNKRAAKPAKKLSELVNVSSLKSGDQVFHKKLAYTITNIVPNLRGFLDLETQEGLTIQVAFNSKIMRKINESL